ncbi:MAG TPA: hypothetical protein DCS97_03320 [Planctomycetes bacterium]|nr:hypothetical protein [Planctomycetota bacterium]
MSTSILGRAALTMIEAIIAMAIFASVMAAILGAMQSGTQMQTTITTTDDAGDKAARAIRDVASELRYADVNRIYLDGTAWTSVQSGSDYYSFKVSTGFNVVNGGEAPSLDRMIKFERGVVLRFTENGDGTGTLYRTVVSLGTNGVPTGTIEAERALSSGLAWEYTPAPGEAPRRGFQIVQLDPSQAAVVGNRLSVHAAAFISNTETRNLDDDQRPWRAVETAVYLRSSMFDSTGLTAPEITSANTCSGNVGSPFIYDIVATNDPTRYAGSSLPAGLIYDTYSGRISGTPTSQGTFTAVVSAFNEAGSDAMEVSMVIKGALPEITSALAMTLKSGATCSYQITASGSPNAFGASGLPSWLSVSTTSGLITGNVPTGITSETTYAATISATNINGTESVPFALLVTPKDPEKPIVTTTATIVCTVGLPFTFKLSATDNPTAWEGVGLPSWLNMNKASGQLSGTPPDTGLFSFTVLATNEVGTGPEAAVSVQVQEPLPIITSATTATAEVGVEFSYQIVASNSPTSYKINSSSGSLPSWLSLDTSLGRLVGTPTTQGSLDLVLYATNKVGTGSSPLVITVAPLRTPTVYLPNPLRGTVGVLFSQTISGSPQVKYYSVSGLPDGVTLSTTTGTLSGKPAKEGTYEVVATAYNDSGSGSTTVAMIVAANPNLPTLTLNADEDASQKFQVTGTVSPNSSGSALNYSTFTAQDNQGGLTLRRGWVAKEASGTGQAKALASNEFLLSATKTSGTVTITVSITDSAGNVGTYTRNY